jgi:hypothetical protein
MVLVSIKSLQWQFLKKQYKTQLFSGLWSAALHAHHADFLSTFFRAKKLLVVRIPIGTHLAAPVVFILLSLCLLGISIPIFFQYDVDFCDKFLG